MKNIPLIWDIFGLCVMAALMTLAHFLVPPTVEVPYAATTLFVTLGARAVGYWGWAKLGKARTQVKEA